MRTRWLVAVARYVEGITQPNASSCPSCTQPLPAPTGSQAKRQALNVALPLGRVILRRPGSVAGYQQGQAEHDHRGADVEVVLGQERDPGDEREQRESVDKVMHEAGDAGDAQQEADGLKCLLHDTDARRAAQAVTSRSGTARSDFGTDSAWPVAPKVSG